MFVYFSVFPMTDWKEIDLIFAWQVFLGCRPGGSVYRELCGLCADLLRMPGGSGEDKGANTS